MSATTAIWHDVECGAYGADLTLWEDMASAAGGRVLELGCGTGRVSLHLARRGFEVVGVDYEEELLEVLAERARGLAVETIADDAREFAVAAPVALVLAPMQVLQLLPEREDREACLRRVAAALEPGGRFAAAILERMPEAEDVPPPLPDVHDIDGWVYSSLAIEAAFNGEEIVVRRLRQTVSPSGELSEEPNEIRIATFPAAQLEEEGRAAGLVPVRRLEIPPTDIHVGSTVVVLAKEKS